MLCGISDALVALKPHALNAQRNQSTADTAADSFLSHHSRQPTGLNYFSSALLRTFLRSSSVSVSSLKLTVNASGAHCLRRSLNILGVWPAALARP